jgi:AraC-like DNA-binding protein
MLHTHEFYEILYVVSGKISHVLNGNQDDLTVGDLRFLTTSDMHDLRTSSDASHRDILIDKDLFEQFFSTVFGNNEFIKTLSGKKAVLTNDEISELEVLMRGFTTETQTEKKRALAFEAIIKIINKLLAAKSSGKEAGFDNYPKTLKEIIDQFNKPNALKMSVSDIIAMTGYNPSYVSRLFKKYTGDNLSEYLKNLRLKHVAYYLETTDLSLREIADIVGIESLSYLNSIFKKKYGVPPIQYRKDIRKTEQ